ncbi:hypothetical protein V1525DRAFT_383328 [Lipomyces kononenkoae]|uniref:Uncharacterized protein n=1 Tax=Lipomyces kononenkoae TaxID=34357 RepID=A0ACC3SSW7_LIPKO
MPLNPLNMPLNPLTIASIIACACLLVLALTATARILVKHVHSQSFSFVAFGRSKIFLLFGALERRALGISFVLLTCSILNLVVSSRVGNSECNSETADSSVFPILLCLESVAIPICHLVFVLPAILESLRTSPSPYDSNIQSLMHTDNHLVLEILKFVAKVFVFAGAVVVFWLPVYILYTNDSSAFGTCFAQSGSMVWYMGSKTAIAASAVTLCLITLLISGMTATFAYSFLPKVRARKRGFRIVMYIYVLVGTLSTALTVPELLYRALGQQSAASEVVPAVFKYLTMASLPVHSLLLCCATVFAYIFVQSKELDYGTPAAGPHDIIIEKYDQGHFSLSFYASPRYEDKYLSVMNPGRGLERTNTPLSVVSTASSQPKYEQTEAESMLDNQFLRVPRYDQMDVMQRNPEPHYSPLSRQPLTATLPENPHRFNFI